MPKTLPTPAAPAQQVTRGVLAIKPFRKLWNSMLFSSLGDWLGLLATTAMAQQLSGGDYAKANFAIAGVFIARLLPAVFLGPIAGVIADKLDRRKLMVTCDVLRTAIALAPRHEGQDHARRVDCAGAAVHAAWHAQRHAHDVTLGRL